MNILLIAVSDKAGELCDRKPAINHVQMAQTLVFSIIFLFANMDERLSLACAYEINEV